MRRRRGDRGRRGDRRGTPCGAEALVENSAEFRMQLDFQVKDAALKELLPAGWEPAVATQGPAKDCNIRLIFIDRVDVTGADNAPKTSSQLVYLAVPVKQTGTSTTGQMIIGGLVGDPKERPGRSATTRRRPREGGALVSIDNGVGARRGELGVLRRQWRAHGGASEIRARRRAAATRRKRRNFSMRATRASIRSSRSISASTS